MKYIHCDDETTNGQGAQFAEWLRKHGIPATQNQDGQKFQRSEEYREAANWLWDAFNRDEEIIPAYVLDALA